MIVVIFNVEVTELPRETATEKPRRDYGGVAGSCLSFADLSLASFDPKLSSVLAGSHDSTQKAGGARARRRV